MSNHSIFIATGAVAPVLLFGLAAIVHTVPASMVLRATFFASSLAYLVLNVMTVRYWAHGQTPGLFGRVLIDLQAACGACAVVSGLIAGWPTIVNLHAASPHGVSL